MLLARNHDDAFEFVKAVYRILLVSFFPDTVYISVVGLKGMSCYTWTSTVWNLFLLLLSLLPCLFVYCK